MKRPSDPHRARETDRKGALSTIQGDALTFSHLPSTIHTPFGGCRTIATHQHCLGSARLFSTFSAESAARPTHMCRFVECDASTGSVALTTRLGLAVRKAARPYTSEAKNV